MKQPAPRPRPRLFWRVISLDTASGLHLGAGKHEFRPDAVKAARKLSLTTTCYIIDPRTYAITPFKEGHQYRHGRPHK